MQTALTLLVRLLIELAETLDPVTSMVPPDLQMPDEISPTKVNALLRFRLPKREVTANNR